MPSVSARAMRLQRDVSKVPAQEPTSAIASVAAIEASQSESRSRHAMANTTTLTIAVAVSHRVAQPAMDHFFISLFVILQGAPINPVRHQAWRAGDSLIPS